MSELPVFPADVWGVLLDRLEPFLLFLLPSVCKALDGRFIVQNLSSLRLDVIRVTPTKITLQNMLESLVKLYLRFGSVVVPKLSIVRISGSEARTVNQLLYIVAPYLKELKVSCQLDTELVQRLDPTRLEVFEPSWFGSEMTLALLRKRTFRLKKLLLNCEGQTNMFKEAMEILASADRPYLEELLLDDGHYQVPTDFINTIASVTQKHAETLRRFSINVWPRRNDQEPFKQIFAAPDSSGDQKHNLSDLSMATIGLPAHKIRVQQKDSAMSHLVYYARARLDDEFLDKVYTRVVQPLDSAQSRAREIMRSLFWATAVHIKTINQYLPFIKWVFPYVESLVERPEGVRLRTVLRSVGLLTLSVAPHNNPELLERLELLVTKVEQFGSVVHSMLTEKLPNSAQVHSVRVLVTYPRWKKRLVDACNKPGNSVLFHMLQMLMSTIDPVFDLLASDIDIFTCDYRGYSLFDYIVHGEDSNDCKRLMQTIYQTPQLLSSLMERLSFSQMIQIFAGSLRPSHRIPIEAALSQKVFQLLESANSDEAFKLVYQLYSDWQYDQITESIPYIYGRPRKLPSRKTPNDQEKEAFVELYRRNLGLPNLSQGSEDRIERFISGQDPFVWPLKPEQEADDEDDDYF